MAILADTCTGAAVMAVALLRRRDGTLSRFGRNTGIAER